MLSVIRISVYKNYYRKWNNIGWQIIFSIGKKRLLIVFPRYFFKKLKHVCFRPGRRDGNMRKANRSEKWVQMFIEFLSCVWGALSISNMIGCIIISVFCVFVNTNVSIWGGSRSILTILVLINILIDLLNLFVSEIISC